MQRRTFIKNSALCAIAISSSGFIRFNGENYEGDCETTTDILGPFYRPYAPVRSDMRIAGAVGERVVLSGKVRHKDCKTPLKNACVELWHCDGKGEYDNDSPDFRYRAKIYSDDKGNYSFKTIIPVPYDIGNGNVRPAHFHMMISATGYQSLITQLYFTGDKNVEKDATASLPAAKSRILDIKNGSNGEKAVLFDVTMMEKLPADEAVIDRLKGTYIPKDENNKVVELYKKDTLLWIKDPTSINGGYPLQYVGNNIFEYYGRPHKYQFTLQSDGSVVLAYSRASGDGTQKIMEAVKGK